MKTTTKKSELETKIAALQAEYELQETVTKKLPGIDQDLIHTHHFDYKKRGTKYTVNVNLAGNIFGQDSLPVDKINTVIQQVIKAFPPTKKATVYTAGDDKPTESKFILRWKNSAGGHASTAEISYVSKEYEIDVQLPLDFYKEVYEPFHRKLYDCEYHYYVGTSHSELLRMQIRAYRLKSFAFERMSYYGGDVVNYAARPECVAEFEKIVLTGKA